MSDRRADLLLHPVVLLALAVWIGNDHLAKAAWPGAVTGKLSDVAGLVVFPLIPVVALDRWRRWRGLPASGAAWAAGWLAATAAAMIAIKVVDPAAWVYRHGLAVVQYPLLAALRLLASGDLPALRPVRLAMDPTDLLALPALLVPWLLLGAPVARSRSRDGAYRARRLLPAASGQSAGAR
jgi:hypothetical protein